ncbi:MAG: hypothetical protein ABII85_07570 [Bacillota bacterium]
MTKSIVKKLFLVFFVTLFLFYFIGSISETESKAVDYQLSSSWDGSDLDFTPLTQIVYDSEYRYFSEIINDPGSIIEDKKYVIESAYDLYTLSELSMGLDKTLYLSLNYVLGNDIDYYQIVQQNISQRFHPIGFIEPFSGTFDGQGFEITNLYFETIMTEDEYQESYSGLRFLAMFSKVSSTGIIRNLGLVNPIIIQPIEWGIMSYVSAIVGENYGVVENVYLIDNRGDASGFNAEGAFNLSGLVSINYGEFTNSFVASKHIRSISVIENESTSAVLYANLGSIENIYYDQTLYADINSSILFSIGLETLDFQNESIFPNGWFYNDHYQALASSEAEISQLTLSNPYPILQGLVVFNQEMQIEDAIDLLYFNELLLVSGLFRNNQYVVIKDIDMNQVSSDGYQAASIGFNGTLSSAAANFSTILYPRLESQGGDITYHSIINLKLSEPTYIGNYASYGLLSSLFGTVENLNFVNTTLITDDIDESASRSEILVGTITGQINHGTINNVHAYSVIIVSNSSEEISKLSVGGLVGEGSGDIFHSSTNGSITGGVHTYGLKSNHSALGGIIGTADDLSMSYSLNAMNITGLSFTDSLASTTYLGGLIGTGSIVSLLKVLNFGSVTSHQEGTLIDTLYLGGIIGLETHLEDRISYTYNAGELITIIEKDMKLNVAGFGSFSGTDEAVDMYSLTNDGMISFVYPLGSELTEAELILMEVSVSGVLITDQIQGNLYGLFNLQSLTFDLDIIDQIAGTLIIKNTSQLNLFQAYNLGNINLTTQRELTQEKIMVSGNVIGSNITLEHLRNEGDLNIEINHATSPSVIDGHLYVFGLFEEVSQDQTAKDGFNGGNITVDKNPNIIADYDVYVSGIAYANSNSNIYNTLDLLTTTIDITYEQGSMDHFMNDGDLSIRGNFNGSVRAAGIAIVNESLMTTAMNLGNIDVRNDHIVVGNEAEAAGIVYMMVSQYAQIRDSANYGTIKAVSNSTVGYAHASGIAVRNDRLSSGIDIEPGTTHQLAKILFTINYGDVYAYNGTDETSYLVTNETRAKAAGILAIGLLSAVNNVNYGNIYSKYLASGIFGFLYFNKFGTIQANQVYISNSINYGKIRQITGYDTDTEIFTINMTSLPATTNYFAFGAVMGKIHTGTTTWAFAGDVTYPIDRVYFGYLINFDEKVNMFALAPSLSTTWVDGFGNLEAANDAILAMLKYMATTNPNDQSAQPFTYFYSGGWIGQYMGKVISYYEVSDSEQGMFYEGFALRSPRPIYTGTDQYIRNYIEYIPFDKVNPQIIAKVEADTAFTYPGIYALSSSKGIENGIFIPDNFELEGLNPHELDEIIVDSTWLGDIEDSNSIAYKLCTGMRQIKANFATSIYDLELKQVDEYGEYVEDGFVLDAPIIDSARGLITYYLPSNAAVLFGNTSTLMDVYSFVEVSEGLGRMVPDVIASGEQTYSWVGNYKKSGDDFVEIGPYHTTGIYNPTTSDLSPYLSTSRTIPVYEQTIMDTASTMPYLYEHTPHTRFIIWWTASGYRLDPGSILEAGYGAYEPYILTYYPTLYKYVGPSQELVTYIRTDVISDVVIYDPSALQFKVNDAIGSYVVSENADIIYEGQSQLTLATVPRSFGIYDSMYDEENTYIDGVEDHYGSIRVYSASYDSSDPSTYRDYDIRIIRTADQNLIDIDALLVNGIDALTVYSDFGSIIADQSLHYEVDGDLGVMSVTYLTNNIADQINVLPWILLYNDDTGDPIDPDLYVLSKGIVANENILNNSNGVLGEGYVTIDLAVTSFLPSGSYRMELKLVTDETADIYVDKIQSSNASILELWHNEQNIGLSGDTYVSYIPFGMYYDSEDPSTQIVDFTNIDELSIIYFTDLIGTMIPSYLTAISISPFSTLVSLDLEISMIDSYRHQYHLTYTLEAEDGSIRIFYHDLIEEILNTSPLYVYKNGGEVELTADPIEISYLEAPTVRVEYNLDLAYAADENHLVTSSSFIPVDLGELSFENIDYFIHQVPSVGFEVDFNQQIELGTYHFETSYESLIYLWGVTLIWHFDFETIILVKIKNDDSHLQNIMFVSDTVYSGFNTIVDIVEITENDYLNYLLYPEDRIMTVLPTTGIYYGDYFDYSIYWIIGQVQKTNLSYYLPTFELPDGAIIRRVVDFDHLEPEYQSESLISDFSPFGNAFNYVLYRVYAHDFDEDLTHYTDYYIAIQDMTNNIRFNLEVINESSLKIDDIFVRINVCQLGEDYNGICSYEDTILSMTAHAIYNAYLDTFENNRFQTTVYGTYQLIVGVPENIAYTMTLQSVSVIGTSFYLENSLLPRKYYIVITLVDQPQVKPWGQQMTTTNLLENDDFDEFRTYLPDEMFIYDGITYLVQSGYTYIYDINNPPGSLPSLGLLDLSGVFNPMSTYLVGNVIYFEGNYYECLIFNDTGIVPDALGILSGHWISLS